MWLPGLEKVPGVLGEGKYGVLVEPGSGKSLEEAILHIIENPDAAEIMTKKAKKVALTKNSSSRMAMEYFKLYGYILQKASFSTR